MTRTVGTLAAVVCGALVALAACGSPAGVGSGSGPAISVAPTTPAVGFAPTSPGGVPGNVVGSVPPATPTVAVPPAPAGGQTSTVPRARIDTSHMAAPPGGVKTAGRQVMFQVGQSGCQHVTGQVAAQTAKAVTIDVVVTTNARSGQMCPMIVREVPVTVTLAAPLGGRTLLFQEVMRHS